MINSQAGQFYKGKKLENRKSLEGQFFRYAIVDYRRRNVSQIIRNLLTEQVSLVISTNDNLNFKSREYVLLRNEKMYQINQIIEMEEEINPQVNLWFKHNPNTAYVMSLIEIQNPQELTL